MSNALYPSQLGLLHKGPISSPGGMLYMSEKFPLKKLAYVQMGNQFYTHCKLQNWGNHKPYAKNLSSLLPKIVRTFKGCSHFKCEKDNETQCWSANFSLEGIYVENLRFWCAFCLYIIHGHRVPTIKRKVLIWTPMHPFIISIAVYDSYFRTIIFVIHISNDIIMMYKDKPPACLLWQDGPLEVNAAHQWDGCTLVDFQVR
jgi:hypothetical protein